MEFKEIKTDKFIPVEKECGLLILFYLLYLLCLKLLFSSSSFTLYGLEMHLVVIYKLIKEFKPKAIVLDPITNLVTVGNVSEVKSILIRLIDFLQTEQITVMFTALTSNYETHDRPDEGVSSLVDAWLLLRDIEFNGERNRALYIMKSRGMKNSNQVREFIITDNGIEFVEVFVGGDGVLTGSARESYKLQQATAEVLRHHSFKRKDKEIERKKSILEGKIASLTAEFESIKDELNTSYVEEQLKNEVAEKNRNEMMKMRESKEVKVGKSKK